MNFSDYMDTCTTKFVVKLKHGNLPITVDILDADLFQPFLGDSLTFEQFNSLVQMAERLILYHYNDVK